MSTKQRLLFITTGGTSTSDAIEVKVGDKVSNWNNLGVQLTSVFTMSTTPDLPDHEYVAVLITAVNRSGATTFNIGAQNLAENNFMHFRK